MGETESERVAILSRSPALPLCPSAPASRRKTTNGSNTNAANTNRSVMKLNTGKLATASLTMTKVAPQMAVTPSSAASAMSWREPRCVIRDA